MVDKLDSIQIPRYIESDILSHLQPNKVVIMYGPKRVGKTTLLKHISSKLASPLWLNGDELSLQQTLKPTSLDDILHVIGKARTVIIDEAQRIQDIGLILKIMVDMIPGIKLLVTGSSSFALSHETGEPLVGRAWRYTLYPIAQMELIKSETPFQSEKRFPSRLLYGSYPEIILTVGEQDKQELLESIINGALFKDVFMLEGLKKPAKIIELSQALAFQIGNQVSLTELSQLLSINLATVERYLDLLEKTFVIIRVGGFARNLRNEIRKTCRYYFWDTGIRNALIRNFNPMSLRTDIGQLWENYLFIERIKMHKYTHWYGNTYFWRTHDRQEIDCVEEQSGKLAGYEYKWSEQKVRMPRSWKQAYPSASFHVITRKNYLSHIT